MTQSSDTGYKAALSATVLFGGSQIIQIIISIAKSKLVALWLGAQGMGLMMVFNMVSNLIFNICNLGLQSSEVKVLASEQSEDNKDKLRYLVKAIHRWVLCSGILGSVATVLLARHLSVLYFDTPKYVLPFALLAFVVLFNSLYQEKLAIMQGYRRLKLIVKTNLLGASCGFIVSVLLFYYLRIDGIIWALIFTAILNYIISYYYYRKLKIDTNFHQGAKESFNLGTYAIKIGIAMSISAITVSAVAFAVQTFITNQGGLDEVGFFSAGWAINAQYLGLVFTAMAKDYFPRLSQNFKDNSTLKMLMSQQGEIALLILAPLIIGMIIMVHWCVSILYSNEFVVATPMIEWLLVGSFIKSGSWGISFIFLAKGDTKSFLFNEIGIKFITLPSYLIGYKLFGLEGIGYAYTFIYIVYFVMVSLVAFKKYDITYNEAYWQLFTKLCVFIFAYKLLSSFFVIPFALKIVVLLITVSFVLYELNKRISIATILRKKNM